MTLNMTSRELTNSLQIFKERRDDLLHEDVNGFEHFVDRFLEFCETNSLLQVILTPLFEKYKDIDAETWWKAGQDSYEVPKFPANTDEEIVLRYRILESIRGDDQHIWEFARLTGTSKIDEGTESFRSLVLRPLMRDISRLISDAANLATPEAREVQAVPLIRIPSPNETRIFLSHKSDNKDMVRRYFNALSLVGFQPWFDESDMAAGANLERELLRGFNESCAVVFFLTEHFRDENYLATEIEYAIQQHRRKDKKFSIITLRYPGANNVPDLLTRFIWQNIDNDLEGFRQIVRGLPIELGPVRWKKNVVE